jgi:MFS family permease
VLNSKKAPLSQNKNSPDQKSKGDYRAWPVFMLSFVRLFYVSIFERALSNYLLWNIGIRESILGFISSAGALSYIVAPILGQLLTTKFLGVRNALIVSSIVAPILTGAQIAFPIPWFLIACRVSLGLSMGLFWPNCMNLLSKWQKISSIEKSKKNFAVFNFSWNFGFIFGLPIGFLWTVFWNDFSALLISWLLSFFLVPISFFIKKEGSRDIMKEGVIYQTEDPLSHLDIEEDLVINSQTPMIIYPILFSWTSIMFLTLTKSTFTFTYPIILRAFGEPSYLTYLVQWGIQFMQLLGLTLINYIHVYKRKFAALIGIFGASSLALTVIISQELLFISIITPIAGFFIGLIHGVGMKIMLEYGTAENTSKYSTINEIIIGIGFGFTPIIAGYVVEIYLYGVHGFIMFFGLILLIYLIYLSRNIKNHKTLSE